MERTKKVQKPVSRVEWLRRLKRLIPLEESGRLKIILNKKGNFSPPLEAMQYTYSLKFWRSRMTWRRDWNLHMSELGSTV